LGNLTGTRTSTVFFLVQQLLHLRQRRPRRFQALRGFVLDTLFLEGRLGQAGRCAAPRRVAGILNSYSTRSKLSNVNSPTSALGSRKGRTSAATCSQFSA
jgi:hypothetical protein